MIRTGTTPATSVAVTGTPVRGETFARAGAKGSWFVPRHPEHEPGQQRLAGRGGAEQRERDVSQQDLAGDAAGDGVDDVAKAKARDVWVGQLRDRQHGDEQQDRAEDAGRDVGAQQRARAAPARLLSLLRHGRRVVEAEEGEQRQERADQQGAEQAPAVPGPDAERVREHCRAVPDVQQHDDDGHDEARELEQHDRVRDPGEDLHTEDVHQGRQHVHDDAEDQ
jgi:hypothetical protein